MGGGQAEEDGERGGGCGENSREKGGMSHVTHMNVSNCTCECGVSHM